MARAVEVTVAAGRKGENWLAESAGVSTGQAFMSQDHFGSLGTIGQPYCTAPIFQAHAYIQKTCA